MSIEYVLYSLGLSIAIHGISLVSYVFRKKTRAFITFLATSATNMAGFSILLILLFKHPEELTKIDLTKYLWLTSGIFSLIMLTIQVYIILNYRARLKNSSNYHYNYFGKKVYDGGHVQKKEFGVFMISVPFLLLAGAYFVARLINLIRAGSL